MNHPKARLKNLVVQEVQDEVLVYDLDSNKAHCLNRSAGFIWKACDGANSLADIARQFERAGGGKVTEDFVWLAVDQLGEHALLETGSPSNGVRRPRREMLKTIGLASAVALPVISSLVVPPNTLGALNCACRTDADCLGPGVGACPAMICNSRGVCAPQ